MSADHPIKLCDCGCGRPAPIAKETNNSRGWKKGEATRFLRGHWHTKRFVVLTPVQEQIMIGSLLGDGSIIQTARNNGRFVKAQTERRREYLEWHFKAMQPISKAISVGYHRKLISRRTATGTVYEKSDTEITTALTFRTSNATVFNGWRQRWYPDGKKIVPQDFSLTPLSVAIWFCDDGVNQPKQQKAYFCTDCFSTDDCDWLSSKFAEMGISSSIYMSRGKPNLHILKSSYLDFMEMIRSYVVWSCFAYKIKISAT